MSYILETTIVDILVSPVFPFEKGDAIIKKLVEGGLKNRYGEITPKIRKRADYEMEVIFKNKLSKYFLSAYESVAWAKSKWDYVNNKRKEPIMVGPGYKASICSLVAYCMGITNIDPIRFDFPFEQFISAESCAIPAFYIVVDSLCIEKLVQHLKDIYGESFYDKDFGTDMPFFPGAGDLSIISYIEKLIDKEHKIENICENNAEAMRADFNELPFFIVDYQIAYLRSHYPKECKKAYEKFREKINRKVLDELSKYRKMSKNACKKEQELLRNALIFSMHLNKKYGITACFF